MGEDKIPEEQTIDEIVEQMCRDAYAPLGEHLHIPWEKLTERERLFIGMIARKILIDTGYFDERLGRK